MYCQDLLLSGAYSGALAYHLLTSIDCEEGLMNSVGELSRCIDLSVNYLVSPGEYFTSSCDSHVIKQYGR